MLIFCTTGKSRTSCAVGCYRKQLGWSLVSIFHEFEQYCDGEGGVADFLFIENFTKQKQHTNIEADLTIS